MNPPIPLSEQIEALLADGLLIPDRAKANYYLRRVGYYRFGGYWQSIKGSVNPAPRAITFDDVFEVYKFDRKLRLLCLDALERIEVSIKHDICTYLAHEFSDEWYRSNAWMRSAPKPSYLSSREFRSKKEKLTRAIVRNIFQMPEMENSESLDDFPPGKIPEAIYFGQMSKIYSMLPSKAQAEIARSYDVMAPRILLSWLRPLTTVRNYSAHHRRLWNVRFASQPTITHSMKRGLGDIRMNQQYHFMFIAQAMTMYYLLQRTARNTRWQCRLFSLFEKYKPERIDIPSDMGFPNRWREIPFWNTDACLQDEATL